MDEQRATNEPWTVARLLAWTREFFTRRGLESPRLCAEILLANALGCARIELYTQHERVPDAEPLARFRENVRAAADGAPIAYLTGEKEFFGLAMSVSPAVLIPRPETEVLVERTIHLLRSQSARGPRRLLDVGTGSGCIAISLARHVADLVVCASDVSEGALTVARANAERHGVLDRIDFRAGDLFAPWCGEAAFDVIVSNPPYIGRREADTLPPNVRDHEPQAALFAGEDGLEVIRRLAQEAGAHLRPGGHLLMEVAYNQASTVRSLLEGDCWRGVVTYRDALQYERVVHAERAADAGTQVA